MGRNTEELFKKFTDAELISIAEDINQAVIPADAFSRKIASKVFLVEIEDVTLMMLIGLAIPCSFELAKRLKNKKL